MALGIFVDPITPNVVYTDNIFVVTEPSYKEANYRYICDVFPSGSTDLISRLRTVPNDKGGGVFNVSVPLQDYLTYDYNWKIGEGTASLFTLNTASSGRFDFEFGVEYGTSPSSSINEFPFLKTGSGDFFKGTIDQNEVNRSTYMKQVAGQTINPNFGIITTSSSYGYPLLSNNPTSSRYVEINDWETVSLFRGQPDNNNDYEYYSSSITLQNSQVISIAPDPNFGVPVNPQGFVATIGVGPQNLQLSQNFTSINLTQNLFYDVRFHYRKPTDSNFNWVSDPIRYENINYPFMNAWQAGPLLAGGSTVTFEGGYAGIATAGTLNDAILTLGTTQANIGTVRTHVWNGNVWSLGASMPTSFYYGGSAGQGSTGTISVCGNVFGGAPHSNQTLLGGSNGWLVGPNYPLLLAGLNGVGEGSASAAFVGGQFFNGVIYDETNAQYSFDGASYINKTGLPQKAVYHAVIGNDVNDYRVVGGYVNGAVSNVVNTWNGTSFSSDTVYPLTIFQHAGVGTSDDCFVYGGSDGSSDQAVSYKWNGSTWTADSPLIAARALMGAAGTSTAAFAAGGGQGTFGLGGTQLTDLFGNNLPVDEASPSQFYGGLEGIVQPIPVCYDKTRFAFINNDGVWDYKSIFNPITKSTKLKRDSFITPNATYNSENFGFAQYEFNASKRGNTTYHTSNKDNYEITTDPLSQGEADWLTEMIESPNVYIQSGSDFIPVNIENAGYNWKTNPRGQKIFQYKIEFSYSNNRRSTY